MFNDVREFVSGLLAAGELQRIRASVSPVLEIAAIADRVSKSNAPNLPSASARSNDPRFAGLGGPALLFENVEGSDIPVLINAWGSYRRMEMALGCNDAGPGAAAGHTPGGFDALGAKIGALVKPEPPRSMKEIVEKARQFFPLLFIPPKRKKGSGASQEIVFPEEKVDLTRLPLLRCWPHDGDFAALGYTGATNEGIPNLGRGAEWDANHRGRYITLGGIHTIHADDRGNAKPSSHNIGMYRVQLLGKRTMAMHWHMHHDGARHWRSWKKLGKPMPVAVALGGESVMPYAATAPLPPGISELLLAGFLNRGGIPMCMGKTVPIWVPANAEIVIEGYVSDVAGPIGWDPRVAGAGPLGAGAVFEGPFGDHTGFYSLPDRYPILTVTAITMRRDPIYPTTVVGLPPQEDYFLGKATERLFFPLLKTIIHDIDDYDLPMFGAFHNAAALKISKAYPLQGRRVMHSVWGAGQMAWTKTLFSVEKDVDVHDTRAVFAAVAKHCHPHRDLEVIRGPLDILDHAAPHLGAGTKIGFDATRRIEGEQAGAPDLRERPAPGDLAGVLERVRAIAGVIDVATAFGDGGWMLVRVRKDKAGDGRRVIDAVSAMSAMSAMGASLPPFVIVLGPGVDVQKTDEALFHWCAHSDAGRDSVRIGVGDCAVLAFDATPKVPGDEANGEPVRPWPPVLEVSAEIQARVRARWGEYGLGGP